MENINVFWKESKSKGVNKDMHLYCGDKSGGDKYTAKNYIIS